MSSINGGASATTALMGATRADVAIAQHRVKSAETAEKAEQAAKEFEAVFVSEMLKPMLEGIETDGQFGGGKGEEVFRSMMLEEYGKKIADTGSIGLADEVKRQMILMQEQADSGQTNGQ